MRYTMGAMVRFKELTGRESSEAEQTISDLSMIMYCAVKSASAADGVEFNMEYLEFCDNVPLTAIAEFGKSDQKKTKPAPVLKP